MKRTARTVDGLLARLPSDDPERPALEARASGYARACGCSTGALFLVASTIVAAVYFAAGGELAFQTVLASIGFVVAASLLGKLVGLAAATLRLRLLGRSIDRRLRRQEGPLGHVHVH